MNLLGISSLFLANGTMVGMIVAIVVAVLAVAAARPIKSLATRLKGRRKWSPMLRPNARL